MEAHCGVRRFIAHCLELKNSVSTVTRWQIINLAFCYKLGFGIGSDAARSKNLLEENGISPQVLEKLIKGLKLHPTGPEIPRHVWIRGDENDLSPQGLASLNRILEENPTAPAITRQAFVREENTLSTQKLVDIYTKIDPSGSVIAEHGFCGPITQESENMFRNLESYAKSLSQQPELMQSPKSQYSRYVGKHHFPPINLSRQYRKEHRLGEAKSQYQDEIASMAPILGDDHYIVQELRRQLAVLLMEEGLFRQAMHLLLQMNEFQLNTEGDGYDLSLFAPLLIRCFYKQGMWEEAEELQVSILEVLKEKPEEDRLLVLNSMADLAKIYCHRRRFKEAEELQLRALELSKKALDSDHVYRIRYLNDLTVTYMCQGRWKEALELQHELVKTSKRTFGVEEPVLMDCMSNLGWNLTLHQRWKEAETLYGEMLAISRHNLGEECMDTPVWMSQLASILAQQHRWHEAIKLQMQALAISKSVCGMRHGSTRVLMSNLADMHSSTGQWSKAEALRTELVDANKTNDPTHETITLDMMRSYNLGRMSCSRGLSSEAGTMGSRPDGAKKTLSSDNIIEYENMMALARIYRCQRRFEEAMILQKQVVEGTRQLLGEEHPDVWIYGENLAMTAKYQKLHERGEPINVQDHERDYSAMGKRYHELCEQRERMQAQDSDMRIVTQAFREMNCALPEAKAENE